VKTGRRALGGNNCGPVAVEMLHAKGALRMSGGLVDVARLVAGHQCFCSLMGSVTMLMLETPDWRSSSMTVAKAPKGTV